MLDNNESEGSLVFELSENNGAKIIVTPKEKSDDDKNVDYTIEHIDFKKEDE